LESTAKGRYVADILKDSELVSVDATAIMESKLLAVEKGTYDANTYYLEMLDDIKRITEELKNLKIDKTLKNPFLDDAKKKNKSVNTDIICPLCGKNIVESSKGFFCEGWNDKSCKYFMKKSIYGVNISLQDFKAMLSGRKINRRFTWKSGKKSQAELGIENNKYKFYFN
jgi:DNA topoisomerase III